MDQSRDRRGKPHAWPGGPDVAAPRRAAVQKGDLKPYLIRYGLTPPADAQFDAKVAALCGLYRDAPTWAAQQAPVVSTDELTGVQALARKAPGLPLAPGQ